MAKKAVNRRMCFVLACTQKLIDTNERVLADLDNERSDCKAAIDDLRNKQEQVMTMLNDIRASSSSPQQRGGVYACIMRQSILWDIHTNKCGSCQLLGHCIVSYGICHLLNCIHYLPFLMSV